MSKEESIYGESIYYSNNIPELSEWTCCLVGKFNNGFCITPLKGQHPNFFWRWMQYLCLGFKWVNTKKNPTYTG